MTPPSPIDSPSAPSPPDLPALYRAAVETGDAAELVRALCAVHGVNPRGIAELSGVSRQTILRWARGDHAQSRTVKELAPLLKPTKALQRRIGQVRLTCPEGLRGRPTKRV